MVAIRGGLTWKSLDLHIHTPASLDDNINGKVTPDEIVRQAINRGLDGIAVTDHNSGTWVDNVKSSAKGTKLTVFPGVEISAPGGETHVHILAILDPDKGTADVDHLLSKLDFSPESHGHTDDTLCTASFWQTGTGDRQHHIYRDTIRLCGLSGRVVLAGLPDTPVYQHLFPCDRQSELIRW